MGVELLVGYGLTETSPVLSCRRPWRNIRGSSGSPLPDTELKILHPESGQLLHFLEKGLVFVRGPQVMKGYWKKPEVTNEKVVEVANVNEISAEPVVITPPRKKETIAVDLVAVKKAVDASSTVQEARRIAREAREQASRASVTAEAIIN